MLNKLLVILLAATMALPSTSFAYGSTRSIRSIVGSSNSAKYARNSRDSLRRSLTEYSIRSKGIRDRMDAISRENYRSELRRRLGASR